MTKSASKTVTKSAPKEVQKNATAATEFGQIVSKFFEDYHKSTPVKERVSIKSHHRQSFLIDNKYKRFVKKQTF